MKNIFTAFMLLAFAGVMLATGQAAPAAKAQSAAPAKGADEPEEAGVLIDSRSDPDEAAAPASEAYAAVPRGGMPASFGQCKGVISDGGRNVLVMESVDDGSISFVQVTLGRSDVSWKLVGRIARDQD